MAKYHLYFHDDFDGTASAVVFLDFFRKKGDKILSFNPINYTPNLKKNGQILNLKCHLFWLILCIIPKQLGGSITTKPLLLILIGIKKYKDDETHVFNPSFKSGCGLVLAHLKKRYKYKVPKHIEYLVRWGDVIDSANYKSAKQIVERKESALKLMSFLDSIDRRDPKAYQTEISNIIKKLITDSVDKFINQSKIAKKIKEHLGGIKISIKKFKDVAVFTEGVVFVDGTKDEISGSHFLAYYLYPKSFYSVSISKYGGYYHISVGSNPWNRVRAGYKINIGEVMTRYGGGGHRGIGATEKKSKKEIMKIAEEVIEYLNKHG